MNADTADPAVHLCFRLCFHLHIPSHTLGWVASPRCWEVKESYFGAGQAVISKAAIFHFPMRSFIILCPCKRHIIAVESIIVLILYTVVVPPSLRSWDQTGQNKDKFALLHVHENLAISAVSSPSTIYHLQSKLTPVKMENLS